MINKLLNLIIILIAINFSAYVYIVLKEKILYKNNIVHINKKSVTSSLLEEIDMKSFDLLGEEFKIGDEIEIRTKDHRFFEGILLGFSSNKLSVVLVTYDDKIKFFRYDTIGKMTIASRYGYFFK